MRQHSCVHTWYTVTVSPWRSCQHTYEYREANMSVCLWLYCLWYSDSAQSEEFEYSGYSWHVGDGRLPHRWSLDLWDRELITSLRANLMVLSGRDVTTSAHTSVAQPWKCHAVSPCTNRLLQWSRQFCMSASSTMSVAKAAVFFQFAPASLHMASTTCW